MLKLSETFLTAEHAFAALRGEREFEFSNTSPCPIHGKRDDDYEDM